MSERPEIDWTPYNRMYDTLDAIETMVGDLARHLDSMGMMTTNDERIQAVIGGLLGFVVKLQEDQAYALEQRRLIGEYMDRKYREEHP
jgi:hypothetical protein